ncbi:uncharacterized protein [Watersipora subatra]|uniref:uncharacterized protein n=1 Tax=Watersipora subatra TaxID=2589382 RepID=UPI00355B7651
MKSTIGAEDKKPTSCDVEKQQEAVDDATKPGSRSIPYRFQVAYQSYAATSPWKSDYVASVLSAICCFGPFSITGLVHLLSAEMEYRLGNTDIAHNKRRQARVLTSLSWLMGLLIIGAVIITTWQATFIGQLVQPNSALGYSSTMRVNSDALALQFKKHQDTYVPELQNEIDAEDKARRSHRYPAELENDVVREHIEATSKTYVAELQYDMAKTNPTTKSMPHKTRKGKI